MLKILYLPYAGGTAQLCKAWRYFLGKNVEVQPIELAGRGSRFKEACYSDLKEALEDIFKKVENYADEPYVIYGHSFGALLTYELYHMIKEAGMKEPEQLFFSGCLPPHRRSSEKKIFELNDLEFINEIIKFNGMEKEVLENKELMNLVLPILRADFKLLERYKYTEKPNKISKKVTVLYGNDMTFEGVEGWRDLTSDNITFHHINGDHFFVKKNMKEVLDVVNCKINELYVTD